MNCDHGEKVIYSVLPTALKFDCNVLSATNVPEFKGRDETKGCNKRDILGETFVSGIPACALCLYPVKALFAMFTLCNVHCVQFALCVDPNSAFLTSGCSPIPLTPFQLFCGQSTLFTLPAAIGLFCRKNDFCSKSHHSKMLHTAVFMPSIGNGLPAKPENRQHAFHNQNFIVRTY